MYTSTLIKKANRLLVKKANELLKPHNISHAYTFFLMELYKQNGLTQSELRKRIGIEQPTAVRTLDRMERDGFILREQSPSDRRAVYIKLTKKGQDCQPIINQLAIKLNEIALLGLSESECRLFDKFINKLNLNLE
jgi:MarR family transcriptional regulator, transcriptional regulator for hemolysin